MADDALELDHDAELVAALAAWRTARTTFEAASAEHDAARRRLVTAFHDAGVTGFSL